MKIRMKTLMVGPEINAAPDTIVDVPTERAKALIQAGYAVAVSENGSKQAPAEATVMEAPENAAEAKPRRRRG